MRIKIPKHVADKIVGTCKKDLTVTYFRASGAGGQHRNKADTAARIKHNETGIQIEATDSRSQADNRAAAFRKLVLKLIAHYDTEHKKRLMANGWAGKIRTYHQPRGIVKDHRSGVTAPYEATLDGDLDPFIDGAKP